MTVGYRSAFNHAGCRRESGLGPTFDKYLLYGGLVVAVTNGGLPVPEVGHGYESSIDWC